MNAATVRIGLRFRRRWFHYWARCFFRGHSYAVMGHCWDCGRPWPRETWTDGE